MMESKNIDEEALKHDRKLHPKTGTIGGPTHYPNGEALWEGSEAAAKLKEDFDNNRHLNLTRAEFKATRDCYADFKESRITQRLDYLKQQTKDFGKTPGQDKDEKSGKRNAQSNHNTNRRMAGRERKVPTLTGLLLLERKEHQERATTATRRSDRRVYSTVIIQIMSHIIVNYCAAIE